MIFSFDNQCMSLWFTAKCLIAGDFLSKFNDLITKMIGDQYAYTVVFNSCDCWTCLQVRKVEQHKAHFAGI